MSGATHDPTPPHLDQLLAADHRTGGKRGMVAGMNRYLTPFERFILDPSGSIQEPLPECTVSIADDRYVTVIQYPDGFAFRFVNQCGTVTAIRLTQEAINAALAGMTKCSATKTEGHIAYSYWVINKPDEETSGDAT